MGITNFSNLAYFFPLPALLCEAAANIFYHAAVAANFQRILFSKKGCCCWSCRPCTKSKLYQVLDYFEKFESERESLRGRSYTNFILRQKERNDPLNYLRTIWNANDCGKLYNECTYKTKKFFKRKLKSMLRKRSEELMEYIAENGIENYELPFDIVYTKSMTEQSWVTSGI